MRTRTIDVEINSNSLRILRYKQYDHNNILEVIVKKNKEIVDLSAYTARAFFTLPNNTIIQRNATFNIDRLSIIIDSVLLEKHGRIPVEITISNGEEIATIFRMYLEVEESINRNSAIQGNPEWDIIKDGLSVLDDKVSHTELDKKLEIFGENFKTAQPDWNETDVTSQAYILNKPDMDTYATKDFVDEKVADVVSNGTIDLKEYAKIEDVGYKNNLTTNEKGNIVKAINEVNDKAKSNSNALNNKADKSQVENLDNKIKTYYYNKAFIDATYYDKNKIDDIIENLDIDTESCAYVGDYVPEDDEKIWFSDGVKTAGDGITYDNPLMQELFACINILQQQIKELQDEVAYLKIHGGGNGSGGSDNEDISGDYLVLEDGSILLLEDGSNFLLENNVKIDNNILLEDGFELLLEDGSSFLLESA